MKGIVAFSAALTALWLALFGIAALILGYAVVEVLCVELAGVVLAVLASGLWVADSRTSTPVARRRAVSPTDVEQTSSDFAASIAVLSGDPDPRRA